MSATLTITWHGISCFTIEAKHGDITAKLVTNPFANATGLKLSRALSADVVTVSHNLPSYNNIDAVKAIGEKKLFTITTPGEYEVGGLFIYGIDAGSTTLYRFEVGDLTVAHLGDLGTPLTDAQRDALHDSDVLLVPVGGAPTVSARHAVEIVSSLEPRIVIPMDYALPGLTEKRTTVDAFLKEIAAAKPERMNKLKITKKDLPTDETRVIVLEQE